MKMQIKLDSDAVSGLFPILAKPNQSLAFSQMQINIKNNTLQMVALSKVMIGIYERPLGEGEYSDDCSFCVPLHKFGNAKFFKNYNILFIVTDDYKNFKFWANGDISDFKKETFKFPKWDFLLVTDGGPLSAYRVFNPKLLEIAQDFLEDGYYKTPMAKKSCSQVQWDYVKNNIKKTVVLMPLYVND